MKKPKKAKLPAKAKKPAKPFKAVPVAAQIRRHHRAVVAARKAARQPASVKKTRYAAAVKAVATRKRRAWSPDEAVALCSARAVAESLRLATGVDVADGDVLALHVAAGGHPDKGAPILDVLRAAQVHGLAGHKPVAFECIGGPLHAVNERLILGADIRPARRRRRRPHALVADDGIWWSWGQPHSPADFPGAVIEEAWQVTW